jgi:hypothetical protein
MKENNRVVFYLLWHILSGVIIASAFAYFLHYGSYSPQLGMAFWNIMSMFPSQLRIGILIVNAPLLIVFSILLHMLFFRLFRFDYWDAIWLLVSFVFLGTAFYFVICQGFAFYLLVPLLIESLILSLIDFFLDQQRSQAQKSQTES